MAATAALLSGCVDEQRIRQMTDRAVESASKRYYQHLADDTHELAALTPCCESLAGFRPHGRADGEREYQVTVGIWPTKPVVEIDGFRSYFVMLGFDPVHGDRAKLTVVSRFSALPLLHPETKSPAHEIFLPVVTFLDSERKRLATLTAPIAQIPAHLAMRSVFAVPPGAAFAVVHTSRDAIETRDLSAYVPPQTGAMPIGSAMIITRTSGRNVHVLPSFTGSITVTLGS
jgi:hypothetical protein